MMEGDGEKSRRLLADIADHGRYIHQVTADKSVEDYSRERMLRQSVERSFEIIGEAVRRLEDHDPDTASRISSPAQIVSFRNVLAHGYDLVDHQNVWRVVKEDLPRLVGEVEELLGEGR